MDRSWIGLDDKWCSEYINGVSDFIEFACNHAVDKNRIRCPCSKCVNMYYWAVHMVKQHLFQHGMAKEYTKWVWHGEDKGNNHDVLVGDDDFLVSGVDIEGLVTDLQEGTRHNNSADNHADPITSDKPHGEGGEFDKLLRDAQVAAYPGCDKFSKLSFVIRLLHVKTTSKMTNAAVDKMLDLIRELVPGGDSLPKSFYEAKTMLRDLGLGYINIDACPNNCALYWKENENLEQCPNCNEPRWKKCTKSSGKRIPQKVLRYFPLKPRLQKLFMSKKTAQDMRWHKDRRDPDSNVIGHPADAKQWKDFDNENDWFGKDPRNIRLGLASDGFSPFNNIGNTYSMWPVMLVVYNVGPSQVMKEPFIMMSLLIPGPNSPGNDIDVYLRPLIDELKELWEVGVETFDAYSGETFQLHAALMWTINDFPAYAMLSGWSTKGKLACPTCNKDTHSIRLRNCKKQAYMGHRRFLPQKHPWRRNKKFNGKSEKAPKPKELTGDDVLVQLQSLPSNLKFGKTVINKKRKRDETELNWRKKSIFFELSYWHKLPLRHNIDVMHTEKNCAESLVGTLMNTEGKTKDHKNARLDLEELDMMKELHQQSDGQLPPAPFCLDAGGRKRLCAWLKTIRFPDGYASNISRCVSSDENKIIGMKSHDYHVLLQRLLPLAIRGNLSSQICDTITELSLFFKELCSTTLTMDSLEKLENDIALILCKLELIFPPSFWDVMMHLPVHLPREAMYGGPVQYRWMYPIERYLHKLKQYVRNKAKPEGSIAEAYIDNECLNFCSMYMHGLETIYNRQERNQDGDNSMPRKTLSVFDRPIRPLMAGKIQELTITEHDTVLWFVLNNCEEVVPYMDMHREEIASRGSTNVEQTHRLEFAAWFRKLMVQKHNENPSDATINDLYSLCLGPQKHAKVYKGCVINGMRFHTTTRDENHVTQNSGVIVRAEHRGREIDFYGVLNDIFELTYLGGNRVCLFHCTWYNTGDTRTGIKKDKYFTSVNISRTWYGDDPYILASQAGQVFYVPDNILGKNYRIVQRIHPRSWCNNPEIEGDTGSVVGMEEDAFQQTETSATETTIDAYVEVDDFLKEAHNTATIDGDDMFEMAEDGGDGTGIDAEGGDDDYDTDLGD